jgi:TRAP-type mannitol/chloroaromatic compound transport system permease small subunit
MNFFDRVTKLTEYLTIQFFYIMFIAVVINIVLRYLFNINYIFLQELVMYMHAFIFLFGISLCLKEDTHVRIDIFSSKLDIRYRNLIDQVGLVIFILPFCLFVIYESTAMITRSWIMLEGSSEPGGLPFVFILKSSIYLFSFLIFIQAVNKFFNKR